ncbi:MAG TPA: hypothetical protein VNW97_04660 [Candidatus Saccharimonadales bacterium]|jgi:hypothetical protein|nr:hypothetical protein [Candidatus Saccharimonadales bacterium]
MGNLAQFDLKPRGGEEARTRALLEDLAEYHIGIYPQNRLALAIWFEKSAVRQEQNLLELFSGLPTEGITDSRFSLLWKTGVEGPPFVNLRATSVDYFSTLLRSHPGEVARYRHNCEVLYFDKNLLNPEVLGAFRVITEPAGLIKGWYISEDEYSKSKNIQGLLSLHGHSRHNFGLIKTEESSDFENCRGILHVEESQNWVPLSPEGLQPYTFYNDQQNGRRVYFVFEGGSLYQVLKFEVKTDQEYADRFRLLRKTPNDRYPEVYLRAVRLPAQPTA